MSSSTTSIFDEALAPTATATTPAVVLYDETSGRNWHAAQKLLTILTAITLALTSCILLSLLAKFLRDRKRKERYGQAYKKGAHGNDVPVMAVRE
ncbi:uncharacterized protein L3040_005137 [Drepanopeziza brunnea f. sp. 'multigermtubi']|uniref:Uncharacterized protein n=1 Tax=Marssonina brunnea f. sp. multigermtubi (strain MB_m1) TaxID=1072389 RepID=K1XLF8_MARBU|nr:uncharacterized protein MBM_08732 [Drepanopeziza brunnea f. sp. 'multigermtubi' MB_m1]EKD13289.1 hypothetical protein MBM_08732 [Drepanopeziza brunnea f. sp. 'multigermtubi' MB_m1]KAJ5041554.1 hypothetical protein L3040_005137 [Drepanopeziza brunnea f. sp. 'multigermtubi']